MRVIEENGEQVGLLTKDEALKLASNRGLDLVEVAAEANPPVAKIVDWGKYNYQRTKQLQRSRKKAKALEVKQMRFGLKISDHDINVKLNKVSQFLIAGHKVKIAIIYKGREMAHKDIGFQLADKVIEKLGDGVTVDQKPQLAGRQLTFIIRSNNAKAKNS